MSECRARVSTVYPSLFGEGKPQAHVCERETEHQFHRCACGFRWHVYERAFART